MIMFLSIFVKHKCKTFLLLLASFTKLPKNVGDLGKLIAAKGFE